MVDKETFIHIDETWKVSATKNLPRASFFINMRHVRDVETIVKSKYPTATVAMVELKIVEK